MTPKTIPYRLLRPLLGFPTGSILTGYPWPRRKVERLVPAAYRAHGLGGRSPIRYRSGVWGAL